MAIPQRITPCFWFASEAEEAVAFWTGIFPNSRITATTRYGDVGREIHGQAPGSVMTIAFELDGCGFTALNGGPAFTFNEAISLQVRCADQAEIDHYWDKLGDGGDPSAQVCGWLKDRYGVSWQVIPDFLDELFADHASEATRRGMEALLKMKKLDIAGLRRAVAGE